ncbi:phage tail protein [Providencia sp. PROV206]|uniref:phage tail protein n=1 Tax=Providencia sp. PROV206 TaxID=2949904 RepID=UPI00234A4609|nr:MULTISPECIES: phage tail protein [unclassified Providencia]
MQDLMPPINTPDSAFHDGDPTTGQLGTIVTALWLNNVQSATRDVQLEIKNVLAKAGIQPDPKKTNQLAEAISQIIGSGNYASTTYVDNGLNKKIDKANISSVLGNDNDKVPSLSLLATELGKKQPKGNYAPAGDYATNTALTNGLELKINTTALKQELGGNPYSIVSQKVITEALDNKVNYSAIKQETGDGAYSLISQKALTDLFAKYFLVGELIFWPQSTPPVGYLVCNGQSFNKTTYPLLAKAYPTGVLPDLRGEFIRGLDAGRNIDSGRSVLSAQSDAIQNIKGAMTISAEKTPASSASGALSLSETTGMVVTSAFVSRITQVFDFDASREVRTANETRARNIAFLYIVRAA